MSQFSFLTTDKYVSGQTTKIYVSQPFNQGEEWPIADVPLYSAKSCEIKWDTETITDQEWTTEEIVVYGMGLSGSGTISGAQIFGDDGHALMVEAFNQRKEIAFKIIDASGEEESFSGKVVGINRGRSVGGFNQVTYTLGGLMAQQPTIYNYTITITADAYGFVPNFQTITRTGSSIVVSFYQEGPVPEINGWTFWRLSIVVDGEETLPAGVFYTISLSEQKVYENDGYGILNPVANVSAIPV